MSFENKIPEYIANLEKTNKHLHWQQMEAGRELDEIDREIEELEERRMRIEDEMSEGPEYKEREQLIKDNRKLITDLRHWAQLHGLELVESNHKKNKQES